MFDDLPKSATQFAAGQRLQKDGVDEHPLGLAEGADEVLHAQKVHCRLPAHGAVRLREQRRRDLNARNSAHVEACGEPADVSHDPPAEGDQSGITVQIRPLHGFEQIEEGLAGFMFLPRLHDEDGHAAERPTDLAAIEGIDVGIGKQEPAAAQKGFPHGSKLRGKDIFAAENDALPFFPIHDLDFLHSFS